MCVLTVFAIIAIITCALSDYMVSDEFIDAINKNQKLWRAGPNFNSDATKRTSIESLMGTSKQVSNNNGLPSLNGVLYNTSLPKNFDARDKWPYCESLYEIRDQGGCGSCWAIGVASVMTDRYCTLTSHAETVNFSDQDILACCSYCRRYKKSLCQGGSVSRAWAYASREGVVSGGKYSTKGGCKSYEFKPCQRVNEGKTTGCRSEYRLPKCEKRCTSNSKIDYTADKKRFSKNYYLRNVQNAMCDIHTNGPILAAMAVYADFLSYKEGIYKRTAINNNHFLGYHTVKILGWGVDKGSGTEYWVVANSWGYSWGDKGFFKIVRGSNHCDIESTMTAGKL